jgi:hypothetical protein
VEGASAVHRSRHLHRFKCTHAHGLNGFAALAKKEALYASPSDALRGFGQDALVVRGRGIGCQEAGRDKKKR